MQHSSRTQVGQWIYHRHRMTCLHGQVTVSIFCTSYIFMVPITNILYKCHHNGAVWLKRYLRIAMCISVFDSSQYICETFISRNTSRPTFRLILLQTCDACNTLCDVTRSKRGWHWILGRRPPHAWREDWTGQLRNYPEMYCVWIILLLGNVLWYHFRQDVVGVELMQYVSRESLGVKQRIQ